MVSGGPDGERVEVVGQHGPADRGAGAGLAFESGAAGAVAAFEVADAAFAANAVLGESSVAASRAGGLSAGDEHALGVGERGRGRPGIEAGIQRDVAWRESEPVELAGGRGQQ